MWAKAVAIRSVWLDHAAAFSHLVVESGGVLSLVSRLIVRLWVPGTRYTSTYGRSTVWERGKAVTKPDVHGRSASLGVQPAELPWDGCRFWRKAGPTRKRTGRLTLPPSQKSKNKNTIDFTQPIIWNVYFSLCDLFQAAVLPSLGLLLPCQPLAPGPFRGPQVIQVGIHIHIPLSTAFCTTPPPGPGFPPENRGQAPSVARWVNIAPTLK